MKSILITLYFILVGIVLSVSSCKSGTSPDVSALPTDSATIAKGENSFLNNCSSCHTFNYDIIGPKLAGITSEQSVSWIKNFIRDPKKVIDSRDSTAQKLFKRYKMIMPSFGSLPDEEIDAIIAFMHTKKSQERKVVEKEDTNNIKNPIPDSIQSSDVVVGVEMVTQIPRSADRVPFTRIIELDCQPNTGDIFILDLRGKMYKLFNGAPSVYMDMATLKPKFINAPGLATGFGSFAFH